MENKNYCFSFTDNKKLSCKKYRPFVKTICNSLICENEMKHLNLNTKKSMDAIDHQININLNKKSLLTSKLKNHNNDIQKQAILLSSSSSAGTFESLSTNQSPNRNFLVKDNSKCFLKHYRFAYYNNFNTDKINYESLTNFDTIKNDQFNKFQQKIENNNSDSSNLYNCKHENLKLNLYYSLSDDQNFIISDCARKLEYKTNLIKRKISNEIQRNIKSSSIHDLLLLKSHCQKITSNINSNETIVKYCNYCKNTNVENQNNFFFVNNTEDLLNNYPNQFEYNNNIINGGNILNCRVFSLPNLSDSGIVYDFNNYNNNFFINGNIINNNNQLNFNNANYNLTNKKIYSSNSGQSLIEQNTKN